MSVSCFFWLESWSTHSHCTMSVSVTFRSKSSRKSSCFSIRLTSGKLKMLEYFDCDCSESLDKRDVEPAIRHRHRHTQCLFFGEQSLTYLAAQIKVAKNTRCRVQAMPLATFGRRPLNRSRRATVVMRVGI